MYFNTEDYIDKQELDELSTFLGSVTYKINSYDKWESREILSADYMNSDFEIIFYTEGGSHTTIEGREYECEPGSILVLAPFWLVTSDNDDYDKVMYYFIHFDIEPFYLRQQFQNLLTANGAVIHKYELTDLSKMFEKLYIEKNTGKAGYISVITSGLIRILVEIIRAQQSRRPVIIKPTAPESRHVGTVRQAITYMEQCVHLPVNISHIASQLNISTSYLYKAFTEIMGIPPSRFILQLKIKEAKKLLTRQDYSVERIGELLGFSSAYHFSTTFKKLVGVSPKQYQKRVHKSHLN